MQVATMKNLIAATALLMAASFAQADSVYLELASDKVAACKNQLKYNFPTNREDKCEKWYEWKNSERAEKMRKEFLLGDKATAIDDARAEQIANDSEYVDNF